MLALGRMGTCMSVVVDVDELVEDVETEELVDEVEIDVEVLVDVLELVEVVVIQADCPG